jgi:hypothetical protein
MDNIQQNIYTQTHLRTYLNSLVQSVPSEADLDPAQLVNAFLAFYERRMFIAVFTGGRRPTLFCASCLPSTASYSKT